MPAMKPDDYEGWYETARGRWIAQREFDLMMRLLKPPAGSTLLDAGCGPGHFTRRFAAAGLHVTGLDPDAAMLDYAHRRDGADYLLGTATAFPFDDNSFDYVTAVTSLCFITDAEQALREMWRVARRAVLLGLLNRRSLLYRQKHGHGAYRGARWDRPADVRHWAQSLTPAPRARMRSAIFLPDGGMPARSVEPLLPKWLPFGGFLAVRLGKPVMTET